MLGAIAGDTIGSMYEFRPAPHKRFELFPPGSRPTDDSFLTIEVARWLLDGGSLIDAFHACVERHPDGGWGGMFLRWAERKRREPYNSFGNGSAMRVSPVGWAFSTFDEVLLHAERSAAVTHDHPEGIKGAQAVATAIFMARHGSSKDQIREAIRDRFAYSVEMTIDELRAISRFDETCQVSVPPAIVAFLDSSDWEDAVRNAVSLRADADTQACIAGAIAEAHYGGVPEPIRSRVLRYLNHDQRTVCERFETRFLGRVQPPARR